MRFSIQSLVLSTLAMVASVQAAALPAGETLGLEKRVAQAINLEKRGMDGVNNWNCKPSAAHPRPIFLIHSTLLTGDSWGTWAPELVSRGYCVFAITYGKIPNIPVFAGLDLIENSAQQVADFGNKILASTGAKQLDVIGHSQGGVLARYWAKYLGGAGKVYRHIGVSPITHGTTLSGLSVLAQKMNIFDMAKPVVDLACPACYQMVVNSPFMQKLNAGGDTIPGAIHSNIATKYDEIVTPYQTQFTNGATNQILQDLCITSPQEHLLIITSKAGLQWVLNQLDPAHSDTANCLSFIWL